MASLYLSGEARGGLPTEFFWGIFSEAKKTIGGENKKERGRRKRNKRENEKREKEERGRKEKKKGERIV